MIESSEPTSNSVQTAPAADAASEIAPGSEGQPNSVEGLQAEADQQGAFNPETGEINWDCPCLGGMAHGPCGEEFKAAFSCFVYSTEEPKGMDCIDKFKYVSRDLGPFALAKAHSDKNNMLTDFTTGACKTVSAVTLISTERSLRMMRMM
jgi:hypothetical protein